jgi:hypothetical protein
MNLEYENSFVVLPAHTNYHYPMVFGGHFMAEFFSEIPLAEVALVILAGLTIAPYFWGEQTNVVNFIHSCAAKIERQAETGANL